MYKMTTTPEQLRAVGERAAQEALQRNVDTVLEGVDKLLRDSVATLQSGKPTPARIHYENYQLGDAALKEACKHLKAAGFNAKVEHDDGYDDGPNRSSPPRTVLVVEF